NPVNFGGYSLHPAGSDTSKKVRIQVRSVAAVLAELPLVAVDVVKVDTEGAEYDILTAFPEDVLRSARYVTGELHGNRDFALLEYLSRWFDVGMRKKLSSRLFNFQAIARKNA
ncbi:MAG TPA: FkbM family methyltransferase, partial [Steroidobacteraceae bacterium]|nr:FkbM family methyltransferase [Steroidobacteraceae bacterium]